MNWSIIEKEFENKIYQDVSCAQGIIDFYIVKTETKYNLRVENDKTIKKIQVFFTNNQHRTYPQVSLAGILKKDHDLQKLKDAAENINKYLIMAKDKLEEIGVSSKISKMNAQKILEIIKDDICIVLT